MRTWKDIRFLACTCGYKMPHIPEVWTKPEASGLDIEVYGIILVCPACFRESMYEVNVESHVIKGQTITAKRSSAKA